MIGLTRGWSRVGRIGSFVCWTSLDTLQSLLDVIGNLQFHLSIVNESDLLLSELMFVRHHWLLKVIADLLESVDIAIFTSRQPRCKLFHALLARYLMSQSLDLGLNVRLKSQTHLIFVSRCSLLVVFGLQEQESLKSPDFLNFLHHLWWVLEKNQFLVEQWEKWHQQCLIGVFKYALSKHTWQLI